MAERHGRVALEAGAEDLDGCGVALRMVPPPSTKKQARRRFAGRNTGSGLLESSSQSTVYTANAFSQRKTAGNGREHFETFQNVQLTGALSSE